MTSTWDPLLPWALMPRLLPRLLHRPWALLELELLPKPVSPVRELVVPRVWLLLLPVELLSLFKPLFELPLELLSLLLFQPLFELPLDELLLLLLFQPLFELPLELLLLFQPLLELLSLSLLLLLFQPEVPLLEDPLVLEPLKYCSALMIRPVMVCDWPWSVWPIDALLPASVEPRLLLSRARAMPVLSMPAAAKAIIECCNFMVNFLSVRALAGGG